MLPAGALVAFARDKLGCGYVYGSTGELITEAFIQAKAAQYKEQYTPGYIQSSRQWIGKIAFDCSGLIRKATGTSTNANGYYFKSTEKGKIATRPEIPGVLVFQARRDGTMYHVGVYAGNGKVIEARGVNYGVVETEGRSWSHWAKCHAVDYIAKDDEDVIKLGDKDNGIVRSWQEALIKLGFSVGDKGADDWFGSKTEQGTKDFQARFGLPQTGIVDASTASKAWDALRLIPNVDVGPYNEKITQLSKQVEDLARDANEYKADLTTLAGIIKKYEV